MVSSVLMVELLNHAGAGIEHAWHQVARVA
jgi:hypothetical protein